MPLSPISRINLLFPVECCRCLHSCSSLLLKKFIIFTRALPGCGNVMTPEPANLIQCPFCRCHGHNWHHCQWQMLQYRLCTFTMVKYILAVHEQEFSTFKTTVVYLNCSSQAKCLQCSSLFWLNINCMDYCSWLLRLKEKGFFVALAICSVTSQYVASVIKIDLTMIWTYNCVDLGWFWKTQEFCQVQPLYVVIAFFTNCTGQLKIRGGNVNIW